MTLQRSRATSVRASLRAGVPAGVLATITMDAGLLAAVRLGGRASTADRLSLAVIGRWAAGLMRGRWRHEDITCEPARTGEEALGIATHYLTGLLLTEAFLLIPRHGSRPTAMGALGYGVATAALPLLVLFPSLGYGWFGLRSGEATRLDGTMLLGHTAFGIGIALWVPRFLQRPVPG